MEARQRAAARAAREAAAAVKAAAAAEARWKYAEWADYVSPAIPAELREIGLLECAATAVARHARGRLARRTVERAHRWSLASRRQQRVELGLGRIFALYCRSFTSYQIR